MTFTLNVNIGLTPQLAGFLSALLGSQSQPHVEHASGTLLKELATVVEPAVEEPVPQAQALPVSEQATELATEQVTEDTAEEPAAVTATVEEEREYTEADVRAAIDRARCRIEGEDWKDNPDGAGYKQWHRAMTSWFKATAALFGADRPSGLPDSRSRMNFIRCCDEVTISNGALVEAIPF